jgi:hypothetical protein
MEVQPHCHRVFVHGRHVSKTFDPALEFPVATSTPGAGGAPRARQSVTF